MLNYIIPFLYEKLNQAEMITTSTVDTWKDVKQKLDSMKGVCVRIGRLKTINNREELNALVDLYFDRQGKTLVRKRL